MSTPAFGSMSYPAAVLAALGWCCLWVGVGYFVVGPMLRGFKPFTTPKQAARGERRWRHGA